MTIVENIGKSSLFVNLIKQKISLSITLIVVNTFKLKKLNVLVF